MGAPTHVPFAIVPANIMMSDLLRSAERATWQALALHAGGPEKPYARPSVPTLARIAGYSERQIRRALRGLEHVGAIALHRERKGCPNEYWLNFSFGVDEARFMALMQERHERRLDPAEGMRQVQQVELDLFGPEPEQLALVPEAKQAPKQAPAPVPLPELPAERGVQTPDIQMSAPPDIQMSAPPDIQMSAKQTRDPKETHHPTSNTSDSSSAATNPSSVVISGGGSSLTLTEEDLTDLADCVQEAVPAFDGLVGRPGAAEVVDAALCVPWLGRKFKLDRRGLRAHCVSYARIEAKRHWSDLLQQKPSPTVIRRKSHVHPREPHGQNAFPKGIAGKSHVEANVKTHVEDPLPKGITFSGLLDAYRTGGNEALNSLVYADRPKV